jgi:hypothetical protein
MIKTLREGSRLSRRSGGDRPQVQEETRNSYATDKSVNTLRDGAVKGTRGVIHGIDTTQRNIKQLQHSVKTLTSQKQERQAYRETNAHAYQAGRRRVQRQTADKRVSQTAVRSGRNGNPAAVRQTGRSIKVNVRSDRIRTIRNMSVRASGGAARSAMKSRATRAMRKVGKKTARTTAKAAARAVVLTVKAILAAARALIAVLSAGGSFLILTAVIVVIIIVIFGSAFGIFFSNDADDGKLTQAVVEIQTAFTDEIDARIAALSEGGYDGVQVHYVGDFDGDSYYVNNWNDALSVYAVKTMYGGDEVLTMTQEKALMLREVFFGMNPVDYRTEVETIPAADEDDEDTYILHIYVTVTSMDYVRGANLYNFNDDMREMLQEMMSPDYYEYFAQILSVDLYGGLTSENVTEIIGNLPAGETGGEVARKAVERVGTLYSILDCSKLVQTIYAEMGISLPRTSVEQAKYLYNGGYAINASELRPGDLIFWSKPGCNCGRWHEIHHVGIYIGNGRIVDASSSKGRVVLRDIWQSSGFTIFMYARPY